MPYKKSKISLAETGQFSQLFVDYVAGNKQLRKFYTYEPKIDSFRNVLADKAKEPINRSLLVEVLKKQYSEIKNIEIQEKAFEFLLDNKTFTVCTGHQLCLFSGPLYFIYKIISTINLSESLKKKYPEHNFIPVYWMASEDHDFAEISAIHLFNKTVSWKNEDAKGAVGRLKTSSLTSVIEELKTILGETENAKELTTLFENAYLNNSTLADATRYLVHELFGNQGLVILDPDDARLKTEFSEIIKDDLLNNTNFKIVNQTIEELAQLKIKAQVNPREINCFYIKDSLRERIEISSDGKFKILNTDISFTKEELLEELKNHPEHFSPNVVLRPLYQQKILPNIAYVGGPGEIAYWLEYKGMFDHHKITFPVLMPRNFALMLDEKSSSQIQKLGFIKMDIFNNPEQLIKDFINRNSSSDLQLKEQEEKLTLLYSEISAKAIAVDSTLKGSVEAEFQKALSSLKNIESKVIRSEKQKQETSVNQIRNLKEKFFPQGILQERYDNISPYYLKYGKNIISELKESFDPFEFEMLILE